MHDRYSYTPRIEEDAVKIFQDSYNSLEIEGKLILTFRDLTRELIDTDRFIPVRSDEISSLPAF